MQEEILNKFDIEGNLIQIDSIGSGNINNTYVALYEKDNKQTKYLVQKINTHVFHEPYKLMKNIERVTSFIKVQLEKNKDKKHKVIEVVKTKDGKSLCYINKGTERDYYRVYEYIDNSEVYDSSTDEKVVFNSGKAFGNFQRMLKDFPIKRLNETIVDFHNTPARYNKFREDIKVDSEDRVNDVAKEILFIIKREDDYSIITDILGTQAVPYRVIHNDAKVNNVMINKKTKDYLAVIDLDTVMPGSMLFDYGDGIRSVAATTKEDDTNYDKVGLNMDLFEAYTDGYLSEMAPYLTYEEVSLMGESIRIITLELAMRFLNDYINGDTYFKINYETHNLDRARNQIALVKDIEIKMNKINNYIHSSYEKYKNN